MTDLSHLNALRALDAAVRHGSFTGAAEELSVTPAAIGQQVRRLEAALGRQLLDRHANGFSVPQTTAAASELLGRGFDDIRDALNMLSGDSAENRVFLTVTPSIGERWLAPRLSKFMSEHSAIDLRIDSTPYVTYQISAEFDFALRYDKPGKSGQPETALFNETLIPVCTPEITELIGPRDQSGCLARVPLIHVDRSTDDPDWFHWEEWGEEFGYDIPAKSGGVHATFTTLALRSLFDGHGLHLAQLSLVLPDLLSGRITAPFGKDRCVRPGYPYSLVSLHETRMSPLLADFKNWVIGEARETQRQMDEFLSAA